MLNQAILDLYEELDWAGIDIAKVDLQIDETSGRVDVNVKADSAPNSPANSPKNSPATGAFS